MQKTQNERFFACLTSAKCENHELSRSAGVGVHLALLAMAEKSSNLGYKKLKKNHVRQSSNTLHCSGAINAFSGKQDLRIKS